MDKINILNKGLKDRSVLHKRVLDTLAKVATFFDVKELPHVQILFHTSRQSYDKSVGRKTQIWEVGNVSGNNRIDIIHPNFFEKTSSHKDLEFDQILTHEVVHIFLGLLAPGKAIPFWLNEGLSMNIAGQLERYRSSKESMYIENKFSRHLATQAEWDKRINYDAYKIACLFTAFLIEKFFISKLVELLKECDKNYYELEFDKKVTQVFGLSISDLEDQFVNKLNS